MMTRTTLGTVLAMASLLSPASAQAIDSDFEGPPAPEAPQVIARDSNGGVTVRAVRIPEPVVLDGKLDDLYYAQIPATEKTEAWIFFDDKNVYVSARLWDSEPDRIVAWEYEPGSDVFLVYSDGRDTRFGGFPSLLNRGLVIKFTKLMRF